MNMKLFFGLFLLSAPAALAVPYKKQLSFESIVYSQLSPQPGISGFLVGKDRLVTVFGGEASAYVASLNLSDKKFLADMTFEVPAGERVSFDKTLPSGHWRGLVEGGKGTSLFLDGASGSMMAVEGAEMKFLSHRTIVVDLLRPAADSRGEPTRRETSAVRGRFLKAFEASRGLGLTFVGITPTPKKWQKKGLGQYVLATQIPGFPLVTMRCAENDETQCQLDRICDLAGWRPKAASDVVGISFAESRGKLLLADRRDHSLRVFRAEGCAHSAYEGDVRLPEKLKTLSNVAVDEGGRLWVSTEKPDDYRNGSLFMWEAW